MNAKRKTDGDPGDEAPSRRSGTIRKPRRSQRGTDPAPAQERALPDEPTKVERTAPHPAGRFLAAQVWTRWVREELRRLVGDEPSDD